MQTKMIVIRDKQYRDLLREAADILMSGGLVAFPTETVYGLGADALNPQAAKKIYAAKGRPSDNPLIVHIADEEEMGKLAREVPEMAKKLAQAFWPGPMTLILNAKENNGISKKVSAGLSTLAVRMPSNKTARQILKETKVLLAAPSANTSGKPSPTKFEHVYHDLNGKIDVIIEDEQSDIGLESTVIDCTRTPLVIARPGEITKEDIEGILGLGSVKYNDEVMVDTQTPIAPGMKYRHYSPEAELLYYEDSLEKALEFLKTKNKKR